MTDKPEDPKPGLTVGIVGTGRSAFETIQALAGKLGPLPASKPETDPVATSPTVEGPHGRAWFVDPVEIRARLYPGQEDASLANWVVEAPWAHPAWHSYWIALVHLRPFPGLKGGTRLYLEGATHELWVKALSPDKPRSTFIEMRGGPAYMSPGNFAAQLREPGDAIAVKRAADAVREIVDGKLNPDTDATYQWIERFGDNMMKDRPGGSKATFRPGAV